MALNGSGIRTPARLLKISPTTVIEQLKKSSALGTREQNALRTGRALLRASNGGEIAEAEMEQMWSFVQSKKQQLWLWSAIDHRVGKMLAYVLAPPEDAALIQLKHLLAAFGLTYFASRLLASVPPIAGAAMPHAWKSEHAFTAILD